jgi:hypothetical protein
LLKINGIACGDVEGVYVMGIANFRCCGIAIVNGCFTKATLDVAAQEQSLL